MHLANHLSELRFIHLQTITFQHIRRKRRTLFFAHRRKLCRIANQHQPAPCTGIYILDKVVQKTSRSESCPRQTIIGYHRRLIDNEQSLLMQIVIQREVVHVIRIVALTVNLLMNRESRMFSIM